MYAKTSKRNNCRGANPLAAIYKIPACGKWLYPVFIFFHANEFPRRNNDKNKEKMSKT